MVLIVDADNNSASQAATPAPAVDVAASAPAAPIPSVDASSVAQSPAVVSAPVDATAPSPVEVAPVAPVESSLLGSEPKVEAKDAPKDTTKEAVSDKPAEKTDAEKLQEGESKPIEGDSKPDGEKPQLPSYDAFKLPEGFKADEKVMGEFSGLLGQLELAKGDHKATQEVGQKLVDLFTARMAETTQQMTDYYSTIWNKTKKDRLEELRKDPYFGANGDNAGQLKVQAEMANFLQRHVPKDQLNDFRKFATENGIDNALPLARVLNTLKEKINKYENEGARMLPGTKPQPSAPSHPGKGVLQKMYGQK